MNHANSIYLTPTHGAIEQNAWISFCDRYDIRFEPRVPGYTTFANKTYTVRITYGDLKDAHPERFSIQLDDVRICCPDSASLIVITVEQAIYRQDAAVLAAQIAVTWPMLVDVPSEFDSMVNDYISAFQHGKATPEVPIGPPSDTYTLTGQWSAVSNQNTPILTAQERAKALAESWYADTTDTKDKDIQTQIQNLAALVEAALKTQDQLTRTIIAVALVANGQNINTFTNFSGQVLPVIRAKYLALSANAL